MGGTEYFLLHETLARAYHMQRLQFAAPRPAISTRQILGNRAAAAPCGIVFVLPFQGPLQSLSCFLNHFRTEYFQKL